MKNHITILFVILVFLSHFSYSQKKINQSRSTEYKSLKSRSSRDDVDQLLKTASETKSSSPAESLDKIKDALAQSIAQGDNFSEGRCYVLLGEINESISELGLAQENFLKAYNKLSDGYADSPEYKKAIHGLGRVNLKAKHFEDALKYYKESLETADDAERTGLLLDISEVYYQMGNYNEALHTITPTNSKASDSSTLSADTRFQAQQAKIYARLNRLDRTQNLYQNSLNALQTNKASGKEDKESFQNATNEISDVLKDKNLPDDEITLRNQSYSFNVQSNNIAEAAKDKIEISNAFSLKGENATALRELEQAFTLTDTLADPKVRAQTLLALALQYEKNGKLKQALAAFNKYSTTMQEAETLNESHLQVKSNLIRKQKEIEELTKDVSLGQQDVTIEQATVDRQQLVIYGLLFIILIIVVTSYFIYKNAVASRIANQLLALKSLRSQMNPHFIFNALNSVNHFISQQDERTANKFLSEFSLLMRLVLEHSQQDFISLHKEEEILTLYLKLEHYRFRDKFDYEIIIDPNLNLEMIEVPPMLIQPYIENAVWHGLRYKESMGKLSLQMSKQDENIIVEISDNGIGRKKSEELKTTNQRKHNSTGLKNIQERLNILNAVYKINYKVSIEDLTGNTGTRVRITLPERKVSL